MGMRKKKYEQGEGAQYIKRSKAVRKLQISLQKFQHLCILKGIYPRTPRNRKRAQKGVSSRVVSCLYYKKDIRFLMQEPIIWTMMDDKVHGRKLKKARNRCDSEKVRRLMPQKPQYSLDHLVKERFPTFIDAISDMDDALTLCFFFANYPSQRRITLERIQLCRRFTLEFLHYVIEARALRKVFVSIKGIYYQAEIKGQAVTWIREHSLGHQPCKKLHMDFQVMAAFVEFYVIMLGFINYRLYHSLNLQYPPKISGVTGVDKDFVSENEVMNEMVAALNHRVCHTVKVVEEEEVEVDMFPVSEDSEKAELIKKEAQMLKNQQNLFNGLKFFLNREVPRESLVFVIQAVGGEVSWEKEMFIGATFDETDEGITHQIVDRPKVKQKYLSRHYIQPQWVYDSINARMLLPVADYFPGEVLPPHLSPFASTSKFSEEVYIPPEEKRLRDMKKGVDTRKRADSDTEEESEIEEEEAGKEDPEKEAGKEDSQKEAADKEESEEEAADKEESEEEAADKEEEEEEAEDKEESEEADKEESEKQETGKEVSEKETGEEEHGKEETGEEEHGKEAEKIKDDKKKATKKEDVQKLKMEVSSGKLEKVDRVKKEQKEIKEIQNLREMLIKRKHQMLYKILKTGKEKKKQQAEKLAEKRKYIDETEKKVRKQKRKMIKLTAASDSQSLG